MGRRQKERATLGKVALSVFMVGARGFGEGKGRLQRKKPQPGWLGFCVVTWKKAVSQERLSKFQLSCSKKENAMMAIVHWS